MTTPSPRVMRMWEWSLPPRTEHLEILSAVPETDTGRPPLLFLHGLGHGAWCYAEHWLPAAAAAGYPAYALSFRGHGGSGGHNHLRRTMLRGYIHDTLQAIAQLPSPPVIIAHSLGSLVAQRVLARYPARAGVLLTPLPESGLRGSVVQGARRKPWAFTRTLAGATLELTAADLFSGLDPATAEKYASRVGRESPWAQYAMLVPGRTEPPRCPTLVIGAEDDALVTPGDVERCAEEVSAQVRWVPGGHDVMLDSYWQQVLDTVLDWVEQTCPLDSPALPGAADSAPLSAVLS